LIQLTKKIIYISLARHQDIDLGVVTGHVLKPPRERSLAMTKKKPPLRTASEHETGA
jgi:hypothetical protein